MSIFTFYSSRNADVSDMLCASFDPTAPAQTCTDDEPRSIRGLHSHSDRVAIPLFMGGHLLATVRDEDGVVRPGDWDNDREALAVIIHELMAEAAEQAGTALDDIVATDRLAREPDAWEARKLDRVTDFWTEVALAEDTLDVATPDETDGNPATSDDDPAVSHPYRVVYSMPRSLCVVITPFTTDSDLASFAETLERHHYDKHDLALVGCEEYLSTLRDDVRNEDDTWGELLPYLLDMVRAGSPVLRWKSRGAYNTDNKHILLIKTGPRGDDWEPVVPYESEGAVRQWKSAGLTYPP